MHIRSPPTGKHKIRQPAKIKFVAQRRLENISRVVNAGNARLFTQELTQIFGGGFDV